MVGAYPLQGTKVNSRGKEMPHGTRLYSIAASRYGDKFDGKTTTLCVRRATYWDSEKVHFNFPMHLQSIISQSACKRQLLVMARSDCQAQHCMASTATSSVECAVNDACAFRPDAERRGPSEEGHLLKLPVRRQAWRRGHHDR